MGESNGEIKYHSILWKLEYRIYCGGCCRMFVILLTMVLNIYLRIKNGEKWQAILIKNGIAGFAFYGLIVSLLVLYMSGQQIPALGLLIGIIGALLLIIAF